MNDAYFCTAGDLAKRGLSHIPAELTSSAHLIYSSPATLAFNSPGAQGFGVKRAALAIPGSVMLLVSPGCCGRNTTKLSEAVYSERMYYLLMDDTDIVTGRHLAKIPAAVKEICAACEPAPSVVVICITCVDALLGTDMERACRNAAGQAGVPVVPCYMYALTREGRLPPMTAVRQTVYSLLEPAVRRPDAVNILGYFSPLADDCELYLLLRRAGVRRIREISRCRDFDEYRAMAQANFNLVLHPEARFAARSMREDLHIPSVELTRMYQLDKIRNQYRLFGEAVGVRLDDRLFYDAAAAEVEAFRRKHGRAVFAVGEMLNADPFELSLALTRYGFRVAEIYGTAGGANFPYIRRLAELSPETRIYSNLSPTMLRYDGNRTDVTAAIGRDAVYYHPGCAGIGWDGERQPFGYAGVKALFTALAAAMDKED